MDRFELISAFMDRRKVKIGDVLGTISALEHEDGSGYNFNVTISGMKLAKGCSWIENPVKETLFVRCLQ